jgi:hypothetical protein
LAGDGGGITTGPSLGPSGGSPAKPNKPAPKPPAKKPPKPQPSGAQPSGGGENALGRAISNPYAQAGTDFVLDNIPVVGNIKSLYEAVSGEDIYGHKLSKTDRAMAVLGVLVPQAKNGKRLLKMGEEGAEIGKNLLKRGGKLRKACGQNVGEQCGSAYSLIPSGYKLPIVHPEAGKIHRIYDSEGRLVRIEVINWQGQAKMIPRGAERAGQTYTYQYKGRTIDIHFDQNGFPDFSSVAIADMRLPRNYWFAKDRGSYESQFQYLNRRLARMIENNPSLQQEMKLTDEDVQRLKSGLNPRSYTWHHHQEFGRMQLVPTALHQQIGHVGGRDIWGGGNFARVNGKVGEDQYPNPTN